MRVERWRTDSNIIRPYSALGYRPPVPETIVQMDRGPVMHLHSNRPYRSGLINKSDGSACKP